MAKRRSKYVPQEAKMGLAGIHERELARELARLEEAGAKEITVTADNQEYDEPGPWHNIDYKR